MSRIDWYIKENELFISLMRFYTIEDAILFTEQIISKSHDTNEIFKKYIFMFENGKFKGPNFKKKNNKTCTIELSSVETSKVLKKRR